MLKVNKSLAILVQSSPGIKSENVVQITVQCGRNNVLFKLHRLESEKQVILIDNFPS